MQEYFTIFPTVIFFPKNSYLVENFNEKLLVFDSAGLVQFWASAHMDMKYLNFKFDKKGPIRISLHHLSGTLQLFVGGIVMSLFSFLGEIIWFEINFQDDFEYKS